MTDISPCFQRDSTIEDETGHFRPSDLKASILVDRESYIPDETDKFEQSLLEEENKEEDFLDESEPLPKEIFVRGDIPSVLKKQDDSFFDDVKVDDPTGLIKHLDYNTVKTVNDSFERGSE